MTATEASTADVIDTTEAIDTTATETVPAKLTDTAALKVRELLDAEGRDDLRLRISVQPGGCAGMQYQLFFDERTLDGDVVINQPLEGGKHVPLVVDRTSAPLLNGASITYTDTIEKQGFEIDNPNAGGGCACGNSFCG
jgi:iron-sulfur cluster assembly accessory protein